MPSLDEASTSVDALVADDEQGKSSLQTPGQRAPIQPFGGLSSHQTMLPAPGLVTPGAPPGLGFPQGSTMGMAPFMHAQLGFPGSSASAAPGAQRPATPGQGPQATPIGPTQDAIKNAMPHGDAKKSVQAMAANSGLSRDIASQATLVKGKGVLQEEDFPALDSRKGSAVSRPAPVSAPISIPTPKRVRAELATPSKPERVGTPKPERVATPSKPERVATPKPERVSTPSKPERVATPSKPERVSTPSKQEKRAEKRASAGVLNIATATKTVPTKQPDLTPVEKMSAGTSTSASSAAATPLTASATVARPGTPASIAGASTSVNSRGLPKTLRLVSTPKGEVPILSQASQSLADIPPVA
ncbi:hypothetical protein IMZ48_33900, partial [Candidatus Bathyarchaeota archaeon]|nr:hypothetical protein [Candidatus Bathyarchaeota archaeon]